MPDPKPSRRSLLLLRRAPAAVLLAALLFAGPGVRAASPTLPTRGPSVSGSITGDLVRGGFATLRISASDRRGWREIDLMQITMLLNGQPLGQINFVPALGTVTMLGGNLVQVGADNSLTGGFFRFTGLDVTEVTGGTRVAFSVSAHVVQAVPAAVWQCTKASCAPGSQGLGPQPPTLHHSPVSPYPVTCTCPAVAASPGSDAT